MNVPSLLLTLSLALGHTNAFLFTGPLGTPGQRQSVDMQEPHGFQDGVMSRRTLVLSATPPLEIASNSDQAGLFVLIVIAGAALAAFQEYRIDQFATVKDTVADLRKKKLSDDDSAETKVDSSATVTQDVDEETTEQESEVETTSAVESESEPEPEKPTKEDVAPAVTKRDEKMDSTKDDTPFVSQRLNSLVQEVGSTIEQRRAMEELGKQRRRIEAGAKDTVKEKSRPPSETKEDVTDASPPSEEVEEPSIVSTETPKKRGLLRKVWRVTKKVVAPWRKWENIS